MEPVENLSVTMVINNDSRITARIPSAKGSVLEDHFILTIGGVDLWIPRGRADDVCQAIVTATA